MVDYKAREELRRQQAIEEGMVEIAVKSLKLEMLNDKVFNYPKALAYIMDELELSKSVADKAFKKIIEDQRVIERAEELISQGYLKDYAYEYAEGFTRDYAKSFADGYLRGYLEGMADVALHTNELKNDTQDKNV